MWSKVSRSGLTDDLRLDSEYYQPDYIEQEAALARLDRAPLKELANVSDGNHLSIADSFQEEGVRYLRGKDLSDFFVSDGDPIYIPRRLFKVLERSHMRPGDVLLGIVGTVGTVGLVTDRFGDLTGSCKLAIVRPSAISSEFLAAYLMSPVGQREILRRRRGAVQMGLILPDLRDLPILIPTPELETSVAAAIRDALGARNAWVALMAEAEEIVAAALGLGDHHPAEESTYSASLAQMLGARRFGAEFFMPAKLEILEQLKNGSGTVLGDHVSSVREMWNPANARRGESVQNYDLSDAFVPVLDSELASASARDVGSHKQVLRDGDLVVSRLRSYLKQIALVGPSADPGLRVGSSEFIVLRPITGDLSVTTLLAFLRSRPVQTILRWSQDGSNHPRFRADDLLSIPLPQALIEANEAIAAKVSEAERARVQMRAHLRGSARLLEEAVRTA